MELPSKLLEQIPFDTGAKIEEHMLIVMDESTFEELLAQPLQTIIKQFKIAVTFLSAYNGSFNVTKSNKNFHFKKSLIEKNIIQVTIPSSAWELESLNDEIKRNLHDKCHYTKTEYPFTIKQNFSTLGSVIEKIHKEQ